VKPTWRLEFARSMAARCPRRQMRATLPQPPSLRGGVADAAIQFHCLTLCPPHQPGKETSGLPRRLRRLAM